MTATCPCCGALVVKAPKPEPGEIDGIARQLQSHVLAGIFRALAVRPMTYEQLIWSVYQGREPDNAKVSLCKTVHDYGHVLEPFGWRIVRPGAGKRGTLRLERLDTDHA